MSRSELEQELERVQSQLSDAVMRLECADGPAYYRAKAGSEGRRIARLTSQRDELRKQLGMDQPKPKSEPPPKRPWNERAVSARDVAHAADLLGKAFKGG
jgi:hypothetical protein